jgi:hypothetical protein
MIVKPTPSIIQHFSSIKDLRANRQKKHQLQDIFFISLCAMICGADNWVAIEEFGLAKEEWLTELLGLEYGTPSQDTFGEVYAAIVSRGEGARIIGAVIWRRITLFFSQQKRASYSPLFIQNRHPYHRFCITSSSSPVVARSCLSSFWMGIW